MSSAHPERTANNFDFARLAAAAMVVVQHSFDLKGQNMREPLRVLSHYQLSLGTLGVYIFFIMSGYLITQSLSRSSNYKTYFAKRVLRIYPALILDILIAVFLFGAIATTLPLLAYFAHPLTLRYLGNVSLYRLSLELPGVFTDHPYKVVNGSMWTLCYEFTCYIGIAVLLFVGVLKRRRVFFVGYCLAFVTWLLFEQRLSRYFIRGVSMSVNPLFPLCLYFAAGALYYLYHDKIKYNLPIALLLLCAVIASFVLNLGSEALGLAAYPYILLTFVFTPNKYLGQAGAWGDFSYGTYIYSFPLQQMIVTYLPTSKSVGWMLALSFTLTLPFAAFSWFVVEKPALQLKDRMFKGRKLEPRMAD